MIKILLAVFGTIILIAVLLYFVYVTNKDIFQENFGDPLLVRRTPDILDLKQQFDDLIVYDNQPDGRIGLDKCIEQCQGYCVEHGQTGSAYCYPVHPTTEKNFNGMILQNEQQLVYPNLP